MSKTLEDIEKLKADWLRDSCWDIEDTEGFEAHKEDLLAFRLAMQEKWEGERKEEEAKRIKLIWQSLGIGVINDEDRKTALSLRTIDEIEFELSQQDKYLGDGSTVFDIAVATVAQLQVRATLLQVAQLKRIADTLEDLADGDSVERNARIWGSG